MSQTCIVNEKEKHFGIKHLTLKFSPTTTPKHIKETDILFMGYRSCLRYQDFTVRISKNFFIFIFIKKHAIRKTLSKLYEISKTIIDYVRHKVHFNFEYNIEVWNVFLAFKKENVFLHLPTSTKLSTIGREFNATRSMNPIIFHQTCAEPCLQGFPLMISFGDLPGRIKLFKGLQGHGSLIAKNPQNVMQLLLLWKKYLKFYNDYKH